MASRQRTSFDINDFSSVGKKRTHELGGNAQHAVFVVYANDLSVTNQLLRLPMNMHLDRKVHARTRHLRCFSFEINPGCADIASQAQNAAHFDGQLGIEPVSAPPVFQR